MKKTMVLILTVFFISSNIFSQNTDIEIIPKFIQMLNENYKTRTNYYFFYDVVKPIKLFKLVRGHNTEIIKTLSYNEKIVIIGQTNKYEESLYKCAYYLVQLIDSNVLWSGWVKKSDINTNITEKDSFNIYTGLANISNDNSLISFSYDSNLVVYNKYGNLIFNIDNYKLDEEEKYYPVDISVVGWDIKSEYIWFYVYSDSFIVSYGRIDLLKKVYEIFGRPKSFRSNEIEINLNTGDVIYSDYPFQYDDIQHERTKKSKKVFYLYKNNLLKQNESVIASNKGEGFDLKKDKNENLYYRKFSHYFYNKVK